jgi:hypothetical protein
LLEGGNNSMMEDAALPHPPCLTLKVAVFGAKSIGKPVILDAICGGRTKMNEGRSEYSALVLNSPVGNTEVDFSLINTELFLDMDDDNAAIAREKRVMNMVKDADFFLFIHDWKKKTSHRIVVECFDKCNDLFDKTTPKAIIGNGAEVFLRKKQARPKIFSRQEQDSDVSQFDFVTSRHGKGVDTFIPFVISKVLNFGGMTTENGLTSKPSSIPYKVLIPKMFGANSSTKLDPISLPVNGHLTLGRGELLQKTTFDKRVSRDSHLLIICSDIGQVAVRALNKTMLVVKSPDSNPKIISSDHELVGLEDGDELTIVPGLSREDNKDMTYILKSGTDGMREVSMAKKYQPAFVLFPELEKERVARFNLQKIVRNCLTDIKRARMDSKNLAHATGHNLLADMNAEVSTVVEEESDYDSEDELYAETQDPVAAMLLEKMKSFDLVSSDEESN